MSDYFQDNTRRINLKITPREYALLQEARRTSRVVDREDVPLLSMTDIIRGLIRSLANPKNEK